VCNLMLNPCVQPRQRGRYGPYQLDQRMI
jgi:hypothetical protein